MTSTLQLRRARLREVKCLPTGHTAGKWKAQDLNLNPALLSFAARATFSLRSCHPRCPSLLSRKMPLTFSPTGSGRLGESLATLAHRGLFACRRWRAGRQKKGAGAPGGVSLSALHPPPTPPTPSVCRGRFLIDSTCFCAEVEHAP